MIQLQLTLRSITPLSPRQSPEVKKRDAVLPCPAGACLELILALAAPKPEQLKLLHKTLRTNPSLLLLTLDQYQLANQKPAANARKLVRWCREHGIEFLKLQKFHSQRQSVPNPKKNSRLLGMFLRARNQAKSRRLLNQWLKLHTSLPKRDRQPLLKSILAKSFRLDGFRARRIRRETTFDKIRATWNSSSAIDCQLPNIVNLVSRQIQLENEFDQNLQTEKLAAMKQLAYGASHEINNPLANVATRAQTLLADETHPERRTKLAMIYQQAMRAHEMISDLMLFAHPPATSVQSVSLRQLLRPFINRLQQEADGVEASVDIRFSIGPKLDRLDLDPTQFLVALDSMIRNSREAIRSSRDFGKIEIHFGLIHGYDNRLPRSIRRGESAEWLRVAIWDNGPAIDDRVRRHMFDPFFSGREAGRGLGFGLSKSWRVIQQHGGELHLDESCQVGTQLVFWLPQNGAARTASNKVEDLIVKMPILPKVKNIAG